jgi:hypothetical protein
MNDRDLLELAARAAGIKQTCWIDSDHEWFQAEGVGYNDADDCQQRWNPKEDDGQALRLAVGLDILQDPRFYHERDVHKKYAKTRSQPPRNRLRCLNNWE